MQPLDIPEPRGSQQPQKGRLQWEMPGIPWLLLMPPLGVIISFCLGRNGGGIQVSRKRKETITLDKQRFFFFLWLWEGFVHFPLWTSQGSVPGSAPALFVRHHWSAVAAVAQAFGKSICRHSFSVGESPTLHDYHQSFLTLRRLRAPLYHQNNFQITR